MKEIIDTYKAEIRHAEEMMETWKGHVFQHTVAEQIKITYERVVEDLESHLKFHGVLQNVSQQRELLIDFYSKQNGGMNDTNKHAIIREVDNYIESINCG